MHSSSGGVIFLDELSYYRVSDIFTALDELLNTVLRGSLQESTHQTHCK